jgi:hypothetical protein
MFGATIQKLLNGIAPRVIKLKNIRLVNECTAKELKVATE